MALNNSLLVFVQVLTNVKKGKSLLLLNFGEIVIRIAHPNNQNRVLYGTIFAVK